MELRGNLFAILEPNCDREPPRKVTRGARVKRRRLKNSLIDQGSMLNAPTCAWRRYVATMRGNEKLTRRRVTALILLAESRVLKLRRGGGEARTVTRKGLSNFLRLTSALKGLWCSQHAPLQQPGGPSLPWKLQHETSRPNPPSARLAPARLKPHSRCLPLLSPTGTNA